MIDTVYYFNINYYCNNDCIYCFSSSTGKERRQIPYQKLESFFQKSGLGDTDLIVLNGGEPSIHPDFYHILRLAYEETAAHVVTYTNGRQLDLQRIPASDRLRFVIPIHGSEFIHDDIAQRKGAFADTLLTLKRLENANSNYAIKFIVNDDMVRMNFQMTEFLTSHGLHPREIMIARLNATKKSRLHGVKIVGRKALKAYLSEQEKMLQGGTTVKYIDIPPCLIRSCSKLVKPVRPDPCFYFSDDRFWMEKRSYYKQVQIGSDCMRCDQQEICQTMQRSYWTIAWRNGWKFVTE